MIDALRVLVYKLHCYEITFGAKVEDAALRRMIDHLLSLNDQ